MKRVQSPKETLTREERKVAGKALRDKCPRRSHAMWRAPRNRRDPIELLIQSSKDRIPNLVPIRYGRMMQSPFAFYRGAAAIMAADLALTPTSGIRVQACGDCHLMNFGGFGTPERRIIFDINDFDETLPGPWEWDVKRLAASVVHAARSNGFSAAGQRDAAISCVRSYRERIAKFSNKPALDVWYSHIDIEAVLGTFSDRESIARARKQLVKAKARSVAESDFPKMAEGS